MAEKPRKPTALRSAGRTALSMLRHTKQRAKLGTLHLPLDLHPLRQRSIVLPSGPADALMPRDEAAPYTPGTVGSDASTRSPQPGEETRALRSRIGVAERRVARLRQALERERRARAQAVTAIAQPGQLVDQLVADLSQVGAGDGEALRRTVTAVLGAYGFAISASESPDGAREQSFDGMTLPAIPGWERAQLHAAVDQILARHPETGLRYVTLALAAMVRDGAATPAAMARASGLTSALARHRMRLALEGLCAAGIARREGAQFTLSSTRREPPRKRPKRA